MFKINNEQWQVKFSRPDNPIFLTDDNFYTIGMCDDRTKTIYIADSLRGTLLKKVLCHEIVHAAMFSYNVELDYEQEEILADIIASYGEEIIDITNSIFKRLQY